MRKISYNKLELSEQAKEVVKEEKKNLRDKKRYKLG